MDYNACDVALLDQIQAAERDLGRMLDKASDALGLAYDEPNPDPWLIEQIDHFTTDVLTGHTTYCPHLSAGSGPRPSFAALGTPGQITCHKCVRTLIHPDKHTVPCDRCHQPGTDRQILTLELGTLALFIIECPTCADQDTPAKA